MDADPVELRVLGSLIEKQVETFTLHILEGVTPARLGQTNDGEGEAEELQRKAQNAAWAIQGRGEVGQQTRRDKFSEATRGIVFGTKIKTNQRWNDQQRPKPFRCTEAHDVTTVIPSEVEGARAVTVG